LGQDLEKILVHKKQLFKKTRLSANHALIPTISFLVAKTAARELQREATA